MAGKPKAKKKAAKKKAAKKKARALATPPEPSEAKGSAASVTIDISAWTPDQLANFVKLTVFGGGRIEIIADSEKIKLTVH